MHWKLWEILSRRRGFDQTGSATEQSHRHRHLTSSRAVMHQPLQIILFRNSNFKQYRAKRGWCNMNVNGPAAREMISRIENSWHIQVTTRSLHHSWWLCCMCLCIIVIVHRSSVWLSIFCMHFQHCIFTQLNIREVQNSLNHILKVLSLACSLS